MMRQMQMCECYIQGHPKKNGQMNYLVDLIKLD
jgi:hypothetical protein